MLGLYDFKIRVLMCFDEIFFFLLSLDSEKKIIVVLLWVYKEIVWLWKNLLC